MRTQPTSQRTQGDAEVVQRLCALTFRTTIVRIRGEERTPALLCALRQSQSNPAHRDDRWLIEQLGRIKWPRHDPNCTAVSGAFGGLDDR